MSDMLYTGFLFESTAIRDLRVYAEANDADIFHYRDSKGQEVDAIIQKRDGTWIAIEIKLGFGAVDEGSASLNRFASFVKPEMKEHLKALVLITGTGFPYTREDGIRVVPLGCLAP
jgi:predicted AAA+ superfamily ATPase